MPVEHSAFGVPVTNSHLTTSNVHLTTSDFKRTSRTYRPSKTGATKSYAEAADLLSQSLRRPKDSVIRLESEGPIIVTPAPRLVIRQPEAKALRLLIQPRLTQDANRSGTVAAETPSAGIHVKYMKVTVARADCSGPPRIR